MVEKKSFVEQIFNDVDKREDVGDVKDNVRDVINELNNTYTILRKDTVLR